MKRSSLVLFLLFLLVEILFAQLPEDLGPYEVGCRMRTLTKSSVTDSTLREMDLYIWYPADPVIGFWVEEVKAYWNARPVFGDTARPALVFSHGGCGHPLGAVYFTSHKASWGMIVIATMHPGSMYGEPDCLDSAALHDTWLNRPDDVLYSLQAVIALSRDSTELFGLLDTTRMAMSGHSFGARTTYAVCNRQGWPRCAVPLSGGYGDVNGALINCMEDIRGVEVPAMLMWGTYDFRVTDMLETYDTIDAPKYGIEIYRATHFSFADTCSDALDPMCGDDSVLHYHIAHDVINHYATAFLLKYLMDDYRFASYVTDTSDTLVDYVYDTTIGSGIEEVMLPNELEIICYPNPFNSSVNIIIVGALNLTPIQLEVFDINGRLVTNDRQGCLSIQGDSREGSGTPDSRISQFPGPQFTGYPSFTWSPPASLSSGIYFIKINSGNQNLVKRVVYLK